MCKYLEQSSNELRHRLLLLVNIFVSCDFGLHVLSGKCPLKPISHTHANFVSANGSALSKPIFSLRHLGHVHDPLNAPNLLATSNISLIYTRFSDISKSRSYYLPSFSFYESSTVRFAPSTPLVAHHLQTLDDLVYPRHFEAVQLLVSWEPPPTPYGQHVQI
ncbi:hypothetical protein Trydic_g617 [Trypoxylus dichotomus]